MLLQDAVIRRLSIVGEAARRVSEPSRLTYPTVPWQAVIGMRNRLVHEYDDIDPELVWETVVTSLPALISALKDDR